MDNNAGGAPSGPATPTPPAELKALAPFLQRAHELRKADPVMSYWCSYYAAQQGISRKPLIKASKEYLLKLMDDLEDMKATLASNDAVTDDAAGSAYIENFALKVFVGADNEDRSGNSTRATARKFIAAANFLELLKVFGQLEAEVEEKLKYAKWKAADIAKAFREGRTPQPGPAGGLGEDGLGDELGNNLALPGVSGLADPSFDMPTTKEDDAYIASELAKLTAPSTPEPVQRGHEGEGESQGAGVPTAVSPTTSTDEDPERPNMVRSSSARARARLSMNVTSPQSPNFSMPLPPQLPKPASPGRSLSSDVPAPSQGVADEAALAWESHKAAGEDDHNGQAMGDAVAFTPKQADVAANDGSATGGFQPGFNSAVFPPGMAGPDGSSQQATFPDHSRQPTEGSAFLNFPHGAHAPPSPASRPLPTPPPREGLPLPPGRSLSLMPSPSSHDAFPPRSQPPQQPSSTLPPSYPSPSATPSALAPPLQPGSPSPFPYHQQQRPYAPLAPGAPSAHVAPSAPAPPSAPPAPSAPSAPSAPPASALPESLDPKMTARAQKAARFAASALDYDDLETARRQLREALDIVEGRTA